MERFVLVQFCQQYLCAWIQHFSICGVENINQVASVVINDFSVNLSWVWFRFRKFGVDIVHFAFQEQLWCPLVCSRVFHWLTKIHFSVVFRQQDNIRECFSPQKTKECRERSKDVEKNYDRDEKEGTSDLVWGENEMEIPVFRQRFSLIFLLPDSSGSAKPSQNQNTIKSRPVHMTMD